MLREPAQRSAARTGPRGLTGWHDVCRLNEIRPGRARPVLVNGAEIAVFRDEDDVYALGGTCPHRGGPLGGGTVAAGRAVCPLHQREFDLRTGISPHDPDDRVPTYRCRVVGGMVQIDADSVQPGPGRPDEYLGRWARRGATDHGLALIRHLAAGGDPGTEPIAPPADPPGNTGYHDLVLRPAQLARPPLPSGVPVDTSAVIGSAAQRPLRLDTPLLVAHSSAEALSAEARLALARGAAEAGAALIGQQHGDDQWERGARVVQLAPGDRPDDRDLARASGVEIVIGRPGVSPGSPREFAVSLTALVTELRERTLGAPIGVRIPAGDIEADFAAALELGIDFLTLDALGTATLSAPHVRGHVGLPSIAAVARARAWLDRNGVAELQLIAAGGIRTPDEMVKAIALGADAVALGTAGLIAIGCQQYRACDRGTCPVGIATQQAELRLRFNADISAHRLATFLTSATSMITDYCRAAGRRAVSHLCQDDLAALTPDAAAATGLPYLS